MALRITEIFHSLQGEASRVGLPTVFVRLTGCPLRCTWCDTTYSFTGGEPWTVDAVIAEVGRYPVKQVCVTGGEPLAQKDCLPLLSALCDAGYDVSLETSGALDIAGVDPRVARIMDLKAPGSGESERNLWPNLAHLTTRDEIKIVIAAREDYDWAVSVLREQALDQRCAVLFSPAQGQIDPADLAAWILADGLPVRFQMQLHKILWGNRQGC
ncbi:MAG: 7-carboxy-7-deazaguanine synthase QueE [Azonexus sp.]|nr:7-carboxy-7-deazaguanine synthase QueE [Azonexus sp.]